MQKIIYPKQVSATLFVLPKILCLLLVLFTSIVYAQTPNQAIAITVTNTVQPCQNDGQITVSVTGGTAPYTYILKEGIYPYTPIDTQTTSTFTGLNGGYYYLRAIDAANTYNEIVVNLPRPFNYTSSKTDANCPANDGSLTVAASGGAIPYSYVWSNGATTPTITGLAEGIYLVTITDANGCFVQTSATDSAFTVYGRSNLYATTTSTAGTCTPNTCSCTVAQTTGGTAPYTYLWSQGSTTQTITNVLPGSYVVTVTDANGCTTASYVYTNYNSTIGLTISQSSETCNQGNGVVSVTVNSGTAPFNFIWSNGATTPNITSLVHGTYAFTITDANGCVNTASTNLPNVSPITVTPATTQATCLQANGAITIVAGSGTSPYSYLWSNGATTQSINSLTAGAYTVSVTDAIGCSVVRTINVNRYSPIMPNLTKQNDVCGSATGGSATVAPTLGTPPYTYFWSDSSTTASITNLSAGYYLVTITDNAGCTATAGAGIANATPILANETHTSQVCAGPLGSITLAPTGGLAPYTYLWSTGQTTAALTGLLADYYIYTITDANACVVTGYVNITLNSSINGNVQILASEMCTLQNGSLKCNAGGGTPPYTYLWSSGQTTQTITALGAGNYRVTISDANNCFIAKTGSVPRNSPMHANISITPASCIFTADGSAAVSLTNGTAPYTYHWGNGSTTGTAINLPANWGIGVSVTDANGCQAHAYSSSIGYTGTACASIITGKVIDDLNSNCIEETGDAGLKNIVVSCIPGYSAVTNATGNYQLLVPPGNYALLQNPPYHNQICPTGAISLNNTTATTSYAANNFYDSHINIEDLRVSINNITTPRPGFSHTISVVCYNTGLSAVNGQVQLTYDAGLTYIGGGTSDNTSTHVVTINFNNLQPINGSATANITFTTPAITPLGTIQTYTAHATPDANDATPPNNTATLQCTVVGSYDPNDKQVVPAGNGAKGYISMNDSVLQYTIRFQNTGSFPASFVAIRDTLDPSLDITTIQAGASSHDYKMQILDGNVLAFLFDPINLTDTATDEAGSHGMVTFYIKQKKNLAGGTEIRNRASIFFDFNDPITTNTTLNTIEQGVGIKEVENDIAMKLLPNPGNGFTTLQVTLQQNFEGDLQVYDMLGKKVVSQSVNLNSGIQTIPLSFAGLAQGVYTVKLFNANTKHEIKYVNR